MGDENCALKIIQTKKIKIKQGVIGFYQLLYYKKKKIHLQFLYTGNIHHCTQTTNLVKIYQYMLETLLTKYTKNVLALVIKIEVCERYVIGLNPPSPSLYFISPS